MLSSFNACNSIALGAPLSLELTVGIMLGEVLTQNFLIASVVLTYHLDVTAHFPALINVLVSDLLLAA